jgi:toxin FitB
VILVDTNVWSETTKPNGNPTVLKWLDTNRERLWLSTIVIAEVRAGIESPKGQAKRERLAAWLARLEGGNAARIMSFDQLAAHALGKLLSAQPQDNKMLDTMLAAQALSRDCPIATRNVRDFEWTGAKLVNPWEA